MCSLLIGPKIISQSLQFQRICIVFNPFAGGLRGAKRARLDQAAQALRASGSQVELIATEGPNTAGRLAAAAASGADLLIAAGGDGTINEVVNGLVGCRVPLGILPGGTANVLASEIGLAPNLAQCAAQLLECEARRVKLGLFESAGQPLRHFLLMAGIGLDARIVYELDTSLKSRLGKLAYWHGGFRQLGRPVPRFTLTVNGFEHRASFALLTRVRNYGGDFEIARRVKLTDCDMEVIVFEKSEWHAYARFFAAVILNRLDSTPGVKIYRATSVTMSAPEDQRIYVQTDGEAIGHLPACVSLIPDALTLLLPKQYLSKA